MLEKISKPYRNGKRPKNRQHNFEVLDCLKKYMSGKSKEKPDFSMIRYSSFKRFYEVGYNQNLLSIYYPGQLWNYPDKDFIPEDFSDCFELIKLYFPKKSKLLQLQSDIYSFEKEYETFNLFTLYFLEIMTNSGIVHKIGITGRTPEERLREVRRDIKLLFGEYQVRILHQIKGCGFLETFFKNKYKSFQLDIPPFTEYFEFPNHVLNEVTTEFSKLKELNLYRQN